MSAARVVFARLPWWLWVFVLALAARLAFLWAAGEPLLYLHQYTYFNGGLRIAGHPEPWSYVLRSNEWREWNGGWTIAPLYYWLVAVAFGATGHLCPKY